MAPSPITFESVRRRLNLVCPRNVELFDWAEDQIFLTRTSRSKCSGDPVFSETGAGSQTGLTQRRRDAKI